MTKNHNRNFFLFEKIHRILLINEDYIRQTFSNSAIFNIFKNNKLMLLFLYEKKIIHVDESVLEILKHQYYHRSYSDFFYNSKLIFKKGKRSYITDVVSNVNNNSYYFFPEIKSLLNEKDRSDFEFEILKYNRNDFEMNRKIGENESLICQLIRHDLVIEFITYVNKMNISISSKIQDSLK